MGIEGIEFEVGEMKDLVIPDGEVPDVGEITFRAACRWAGHRGEHQTPAAGFEVIDIPVECVAGFGKLVRMLDAAESEG